MTIESRQLENEDDYQAVRQLLQRIFATDGPPDNGTVGDLDWWRFTGEDPEAIWTSRIWLDESGTVVGFAWPSGDRLDHFSDPAYRNLEPEMVAWAEAQIRASGKHSSMTAFANDSHGWRQEQLQALGFERGDDAFRYWYRQLDDLPVPTPLSDYVIRNVRGEEDVAARVAAHRDAFAPSKMTEAKHRAVMASPTYRPELDLIVEAPDRSVAAYCLVWLDGANAHGVFEPVGCHSAHRQRGLTKAVVYEGMRRLRDLGAATASVVSNPSEVAANRLYASVGFTDLDMNRHWVISLT
ncbi:MAG TPA: GNAT family N-acetyltransferase [Thermomicrobiales bacterium]|nr:GNAT family N-acetyltransferase [Thermomicrobiales bacterium]